MTGGKIWTGYIHFRETNVPVKLHPVVKENRIQFHFLHRRDQVRLLQQMICAHEKVPVPTEEQAKGFELEEGKYLLVDPAELEAAELVLGVYEGGELVYIGHSGGGFGTQTLRDLYERLQPLIQKQCPFKIEPPSNTPVTWVKPKLVCEVTFAGWTKEGLMRQPVFSRLREDKATREVVREKPEEI